jgi:hypothetical protein
MMLSLKLTNDLKAPASPTTLHVELWSFYLYYVVSELTSQVLQILNRTSRTSLFLIRETMVFQVLTLDLLNFRTCSSWQATIQVNPHFPLLVVATQIVCCLILTKNVSKSIMVTVLYS